MPQASASPLRNNSRGAESYVAWKWNRRDRADSQSELPDVELPVVTSDGSDDQYQETVGVILRVMAQFALDTEEQDAMEASEVFEQWQRHLMLGMSRPGSPAATEKLPMHQRDWPGVRQFFGHHRRSEHRHITSSFTDLRRIIWALVNGLNRAVEHDDDADSGVREELTRLNSAIQSDSIETIKREVLIAISRIGTVLSQRNRERAATIKELGDQLEKLGNQLRDARAESALDALTRVHNRKALDDYLAQTLDLHRLFEHPACLMLADIDRFKEINDRYGHQAGDAVLQAVAGQLGRTFMMKNDFIARYGGEEFAIVLRHTPLDAGEMLCERLLDGIRKLEIRHEGAVIPVTVSVGVAAVRKGDTAQSWIQLADRALYEAKNRGRNRMMCAA